MSTSWSRADTPQEEHFSFKEQFTDSSGTVCITENFHYANGQVQYDNMTITPGAC